MRGEDLDKLADEFGGFFDQALASRARPEGKWMVVGAMKPEWVARMKTAGVMPSTAEIAIHDRNIADIFRVPRFIHYRRRGSVTCPAICATRRR